MYCMYIFRISALTSEHGRVGTKDTGYAQGGRLTDQRVLLHTVLDQTTCQVIHTIVCMYMVKTCVLYYVCSPNYSRGTLSCTYSTHCIYRTVPHRFTVHRTRSRYLHSMLFCVTRTVRYLHNLLSIRRYLQVCRYSIHVHVTSYMKHSVYCSSIGVYTRAHTCARVRV